MSDLPPSGWYPDPDQADTVRYWDGERWTDQRAPARTSAPSSNSIPANVGWAGACAVGMVVGAIGPWVDAGFVTAGGLDGDGSIVLGAAILALAVVLWGLSSRGAYGAVATLTLLAGLTGAATSIYDIINIESSNDTEIFGQTVEIGSPGWGLWLSAVASVGLAVSGATIFQLDRSRQR